MDRHHTLIPFGLAFLLAGMNGCDTTGLAPLHAFMDKYGYTLYEPPRSNHGPGWTFRMARTYDGKTIPMTVCDNLYPAVKISNAKVDFPSSTMESELDTDFAVDLLEGLIDNVGKAKATLKSKGVKSMKVTWGVVHAEELLPEQTFSPSGNKIEVDSACAAHLADLKKKGEFGESIFMVQQAIKVEQMNYEASAKSESAGSVAVSLKQLLNLRPQVNVINGRKDALVIKEPRYVGFRAFLLTDVAPTGLLGPETAIVSGRELSRKEVATLFRP